MNKEKLLNSIIDYYHGRKESKICNIVNNKLIIEDTFIDTQKNIYNIITVSENECYIKYTPNNQLFFYYNNIEMEIVKNIYEMINKKDTQEQINNVKMQMLFDFNTSSKFYNQGIYVPEEILIKEDASKINVILNTRKYLFKKQFTETSDFKEYYITYDTENSSITDNLDIDIHAYFTDSNYSLFSIISALILLKFNQKGLNVNSKIKALYNQFNNNEKDTSSNRIRATLFDLMIRTYTDTKILLMSREYHINRYHSLLMLDNKVNDINFDILKLPFKEILSHYNVSPSKGLLELLKEDIYNIVYIKKLSSLGFENRHIYLLLKNHLINDSTFNNIVFKNYIKNLNKKTIVKKLINSEYASTMLNDIDLMLKEMPDFIINPKLSLENLEDEVIIKYNNSVNYKGDKIIIYDLPGIDYSQKEFEIFHTKQYSLVIPLKISQLHYYGMVLKNCAFSHKESVLNKKIILAAIYKNNKIKGLIKLSSDFSQILEAKGKCNTILKKDLFDFIIQFCSENEIKILTKDLSREEVA